MSEMTEKRALAQRHLLPRSPSDRVVIGLLACGLVLALVVRVDPIYGLLPGALAAIVQHVGGHIRAWRSTGIERAFVMESTAISFYVLFATLVVAAGADSLGVDVPIGWLVFIALMIETTVRQIRSTRYA